MLAPFPGTPVREQAEKFKLKILTSDWSQYHANHAITETEGVDRATQEAIATEIDGATERLFWTLAARIENGSATAEERESYAAIERQGVYYALMMDDLLETRGSFYTETSVVSEETAIAGFLRHVGPATGRATDHVERALRYGLENDLLRYRSENGVCTWQFADSEQSLRVTELARKPPLRPDERSFAPAPAAE
jgi:hypothetical protein